MKSAAVALVWLGIVVGVAFLATPVKFAAPSLELPTALEVGRVTFRLLARVEWLFAAALVITTRVSGYRLPWSAFVVFAIVVLESAWLLPALGARSDVIIAGGLTPPSSLHHVFVLGKAIECLALGHAAYCLSRPPVPTVASEQKQSEWR